MNNLELLKLFQTQISTPSIVERNKQSHGSNVGRNGNLKVCRSKDAQSGDFASGMQIIPTDAGKNKTT